MLLEFCSLRCASSWAYSECTQGALSLRSKKWWWKPLSHSLASLTQQSRPGAVDIETSVKTKAWRLMMAWGRSLPSLFSNLSLHTMTVKAQSLPITSTQPGHREMWVKSQILLLPPRFFPSICLLVSKISPWAQNFLLAMNVSSGCQWPGERGREGGEWE